MQAERLLDILMWRPVVGSLASTLKMWHNRARQRRHLARLDDRMLRDIGIDPIAASREFEKPFWRT